jgi:hypothetical protein
MLMRLFQFLASWTAAVIQHWIDQHYNNVLTMGVSQQGLYLASMFLFRFMHPPLLVPWSEIKVRRNKGWVFEYVTFTMGHELAIPLRIREKLAAKLRQSAGDCWPVEET